MTRKVEWIASLETEVTVRKSLADIQVLCEKFGVTSFSARYLEGGAPLSVRFTAIDPVSRQEFAVEMIAPTHHLQQVLRSGRTRNPKPGVVEAQAARIAWRHLHDCIRAQLIAVQDGLVTFGEAFLPHLMVKGSDGQERSVVQMMESAGLQLSAWNESQRLLLPGAR